MKRPERGDQEVGLSAEIRLPVYVKYILVYIYFLTYGIMLVLFFPEHTTSSSSSSSSSKRPRLDQIPAANLDADDPLTDVSVYNARHFGHLT